MSATYTIKPIKVGSLEHYRGTFSTNQEQYKTKEWVPVLIFLIEGNGHKILVDTGGGDPESESMKKCTRCPVRQLPEEHPDKALQRIGVDPSEIDTVILTHLHWDHCYNNQCFPQAEFFVQQKEMLYSIMPASRYQITYEAFTAGLIPPWARQETKWNLVDGDYQLTDGIRLVTLPGHTPGMQGVLVDTTAGQYLIAGDALPLYDNFEDGTFRMSGLAHSMDDYCATFEKIKALHPAAIIPGHEPRIEKIKIFPEV